MLKHYRLKHGTFTLQQPIPCLHMDCLCSFKSFNALKVHLSVWHSQSDRQTSEPKVAFHCQLCEYVQPCTESEFFTHLHSHLKLKHVFHAHMKAVSLRVMYIQRLMLTKAEYTVGVLQPNLKVQYFQTLNNQIN